MKAPQTSWVSSAEDSEVVLDLGEGRRFHLLYYPGIEQRWKASSMYLSAMICSNGRHRGPDGSGQLLQWMTVNNSVRNGSPAVLEGRYVKIAAPNRLTTIMEVLARDADSEGQIKLSLAAGKGEALIDEQDSLDSDPSWYNSAYFDEIYHARTGYEHANAIRGTEQQYLRNIAPPAWQGVHGLLYPETWHDPPLPGAYPALAGVLMLPAMYLLGKLLTKKAVVRVCGHSADGAGRHALRPDPHRYH